MSPKFANEKLVIDLKAVLADIDALTAMDGVRPWVRGDLLALRADITATEFGAKAQKDLEDDRERARQGALAEAAETAKEIEFK